VLEPFLKPLMYTRKWMYSPSHP